jgi:hypothetical protein
MFDVGEMVSTRIDGYVRQKTEFSILWYYRILKNRIYPFYCNIDVFKMDMEMGFP